MDLAADSAVPFPRDLVFSVYRDEVVKLLPYLPNVRNIENRSRKVDGARVELVNDWSGGGDVPVAIRAILSESMLSWTDYALWSSDDWWCDWRIETRAFTEAVRCAGRNAFVDDGHSKTVLKVRGTIEIDPKKIRGVPAFLAGKVSRGVESFLVERIQSNLVETVRGLTKYLEAR